MVGILRRLALGVAAALVVGVVCGGVARLLMRVMVVLADEEGSFSLAGTVAIVLTYAVFALPGAVLAAGWGGCSTNRWGRTRIMARAGRSPTTATTTAVWPTARSPAPACGRSSSSAPASCWGRGSRANGNSPCS